MIFPFVSFVSWPSLREFSGLVEIEEFVNLLGGEPPLSFYVFFSLKVVSSSFL